MKKNSVKIGTRGSQLALFQAELTKTKLLEKFPGVEVEIVIIKTKGDKILDVALSKIGDKGLFTKEIENQLLEGEIDIAVHSMKDLPSEITPGLIIGAVLERENPQDILIAKKNLTLEQLPPGAVV